jgi:hypothetical protein
MKGGVVEVEEWDGMEEVKIDGLRRTYSISGM